MNWKIIVIGGIVFYVVQWIVGFATGAIIHEGVLEELYRANQSFWRPELNQDPPDVATLMPRWIATGLTSALILAGVYGWIRSAFSGDGWLKGIKFGVVLVLVTGTWSAGWSGVFNLPDAIWAWWIAESVLYFVIGGAALGWVSGKLAPEAGRSNA